MKAEKSFIRILSYPILWNLALVIRPKSEMDKVSEVNEVSEVSKINEINEASKVNKASELIEEFFIYDLDVEKNSVFLDAAYSRGNLTIFFSSSSIKECEKENRKFLFIRANSYGDKIVPISECIKTGKSTKSSKSTESSENAEDVEDAKEIQNIEVIFRKSVELKKPWYSDNFELMHLFEILGA